MADASRGVATELPAAVLEPYLKSIVPGYAGPLTVKKFSFGQSNPTYLLAAPSGKLVLRKKPPGRLVPSAHAVEREYAVLHALAGSRVPVPRVFGLCTDESLVGTPFYVMEFVDGRLFTDPALPQVPRAQRKTLYKSAVQTLAEIHRVPVDKVGLSKFGPPSGYFERQLKRWTMVAEAQAKAVGPISDMDVMLKWLQQHLPPDMTTLVHGDYKLDNVIFHGTEPRVAAVLDWEMSTLGHPMADVANMMYMYYMPRLEGTIVQGLAGVDLEEEGLPTEQEMLKWYSEAAGRPYPDPHWQFYLSFCFFKQAVIIQGVSARASAGSASSSQASLAGAFVEVLAGIAKTQMGLDAATSRL